MTVSFEIFLMPALVVLAAHHGECRGGNGGAETRFGEVHHLVFFACCLLEELVRGEGCGGDTDDEVDVFSEVDFFCEALDEAPG